MTRTLPAHAVRYLLNRGKTSAPGWLVLPYPVSANRYWRHNRGRIHVSSEAMAFRKRVAIIAKAAGVRVTSAEVEVLVHIYRPAKRGDLDNSLKVLLDSLRGVAYVDDAQIVRLEAHRHDDKARPRAEVMVRAVDCGDTAAPVRFENMIGKE